MHVVGGIHAAVDAVGIARDPALDREALRRRHEHEVLQIVVHHLQVALVEILRGRVRRAGAGARAGRADRVVRRSVVERLRRVLGRMARRRHDQRLLFLFGGAARRRHALRLATSGLRRLAVVAQFDFLLRFVTRLVDVVDGGSGLFDAAAYRRVRFAHIIVVVIVDVAIVRQLVYFGVISRDTVHGDDARCLAHATHRQIAAGTIQII